MQMSLDPTQSQKAQPSSPTRTSQLPKKEVFLSRQAKENKYYFNNSYLKKNASNSIKKENYSYHSRKGLSKSKNSQLQMKIKKRSSQGVDKLLMKDEAKLGSHMKGVYARQFLLLGNKGACKTFLKDSGTLNVAKRKKRSSLQNKTGGRVHTEKPSHQVLSSKFINLNSQVKGRLVGNKKKKSHIFHETENSFLARIWPDKSHLLKKESIYETMAKHNRKYKKSKKDSQLEEIRKERASRLIRQKKKRR